ncbi:MAG: amino acid adenylation domain-containing protein, partial [Acidobacteriota bacterium]
RLAIHPAGPASLAELAAGVEDRRATSVFLTTGLFHQLATREGAGELARLGAVRWLATGGDTASPEVCRRVLGALPGTVLGNAYGPTENSSVTTAHVMASATGVAEPVPIGRPIPDTTVHVVDPELRPAPVGVPGELVTGGAGLARGYLGRPALTAERFVPDPFAPAAGSRLYRTGDLVRWLPEGRIEFLGRIDHQVKVRGFRIEPGEVEAVLARHPAVAEAVVLARPAPDGGPGGGKALVAYAVAAPGAAPEPAELRGHLAARLPGFMVPAAVVVLPELPLTPSGKIDRRALPEPDWAGAGGLRSGRGDGGAAPPRTPVEEVIAGVWAEVLGGPVPADLAAEAPGDEAPAIGREDDFFAAGGHSLAAARVVARMRDALGVELPLARLFETPTVAGLAEAVERELSGGAGAAAIPPVRPIGPADASYAPMSFAQERLWFLDRLEPDAPTYNLPAIYRLSGGLDVAALARSLRRIVARHEALRTRFEDGGDAPRQVIAPADGPRSRLPLPVVDLSALPEPARRREAALRTARECRRPFDLGSGASGGSLLRAHLLRLTPPGAHAEHRLLLVFHHIVSDGWSIGVFERELSALYGVFRGIDPASDPLPPLPVQYVDFARWQREWLRGEVLDAQLAHWTGRLGDAPAVELPADRPRPARPTYRGRLLPIAYPPATARGLEALGRREGATGFMTLLAGFAALISRWTGHDDLVVGAPVANRRRAELEGLIGFFVNTLALRIDLSGPSPSDASPPDGLTFRGLLGRVRRTAIESYVHQDLPFERLVEALGIERDPSRNPLFQVMLSVEPGGEREALRTFGGGGGSEPGRPALEIAPEPVDAGISKFDLTLFALAGGGELSATAEYAADLFDGATVRRLLDHLGTLLAAAVADPDVPVADLPLVSAGERHQVLVEWGGPSPLPGRQAERPGSGSTDRAGLGAACIHERFFARAERTPDAEALVAGAERLTYRELARRARAVAGSLGGLAPEARVGICAERTADLVAALLGTLAAGGVYVPLDPDYPRRRLEGMLADSGAVALLADGPHRELAGSLAAAVGASGPAPAVLSLEEAVAGTDAAPIPKLEPGRLAYLIYTSGSTGRPKGVAIEHRAASALIDWSRRAFSDEELAGVAAVTSISFDLSVFELFVPLARGGRVILAADALALPDLPAAGEVTLLNTVPSSAAELERAGKIPPAAATINLAGEPLTRDLVDRLHALPGVRRVLNLYGPSEDTTYSTWTEVAGTEVGRAGPDSGDRQPTIGRAVAGTASRVVDRSLRPVPIGVPGELLLGGAGLARGYLGRPALTAERWVPAPGGARLYRTGDLVRRLPDGRLDFLGRIDHQVKVRGFRIELGEVEAALAALPEVAEAAAGVRGTEAADRRLVAWVVP